MGTVFLGKQRDLGRKVAIKCILCQRFADERDVNRFKREALVLARLEHAGIVRIFTVEERESLLFIVSEFIEGETLSDRLERQGAYKLEEGIELIAEVGRVVSFVHKKGIVHRDIKAENIILPHSGGVKVIDFGLAKDQSGKSTVGDVTEMGKVLGTPQYLAPEVITGGRPTPQSDVYALAVLLYQVLSNSYPFDGGPLEILTKHLQAEIPSLSGRVSGVTPQLDGLLRQAMAKELRDRLQSMDQFVGGLDKVLLGQSVPEYTIKVKSTSFMKRSKPKTAKTGPINPQLKKPNQQFKYLYLLLLLLLPLVFGLLWLFSSFRGKGAKGDVSVTVEAKSAIRRGKEGYGLFLSSTRPVIIHASGIYGKEAFNKRLSDKPAQRHLFVLPNKPGHLSQLKFVTAGGSDVKIPIKAIVRAFSKAVVTLRRKDLLYQLNKAGYEIPRTERGKEERAKYLYQVLSADEGAARCQVLVSYLPILFQSGELSYVEKMELFHQANELLAIDMAAAFASATKLLDIEGACAAFSSFAQVKSFSGRKLKEFPDHDNNLMPLDAYTLKVADKWNIKRRKVVAKFVKEEMAAKKKFSQRFKVSADELKDGKYAYLYFSIHSAEPQCMVEVELNGELLLPYRLESVRQAYLEHLNQLGAVKEYILRRSVPLEALKGGWNEIVIRARAPFLANVLKDTLAEARTPGLDEVWFEIGEERPIE